MYRQNAYTCSVMRVRSSIPAQATKMVLWHMCACQRHSKLVLVVGMQNTSRRSQLECWCAGIPPTQIICLVYIHVVRARRKHGSGHVENNRVRAAKPRFVFLPSLLGALYPNLIVLVKGARNALLYRSRNIASLCLMSQNQQQEVEKYKGEPVIHLVSYRSPISLPPRLTDWGAGFPLHSRPWKSAASRTSQWSSVYSSCGRAECADLIEDTTCQVAKVPQQVAILGMCNYLPSFSN